MKKITKVLLGLLAGALAVGFASCKQVQDVNVVSEYTTSAKYVYTATGTITVSGTDYTVDSAMVDASWNYNKETDTNMTTYTISGTYYYKVNATDTNYTSSSATFYLYKVNGNFCERKTTNGKTTYEPVSGLTGAPGDGTFSYTGRASTYDVALTFTKL